jgi:hypothetical protein
MKPLDDAQWNDLGGLWRAQALPGPDLERLRREARRGRRRERLLSLVDVGALVVAAVVVGRFAAERGAAPAAQVALATLVAAGVFTGWTLWNRRAQWRRFALAPVALVDGEVQRAQASRRFWRVNTRVMFALVGASLLLATAQWAGWVAGLSPQRGWIVAAAANVPLAMVSVLWARRRERALRERLDHLEALRRQLAD